MRRRGAVPVPAERVADLAPASVLGVALVVLVSAKGAIVVETLQHPQTIAVVAALVAIWLALGRVVLPRVAPAPARLVAMLTLSLVIVWFLVAPYFRHATASEQLPTDIPTAPLTTGAVRGLAHDGIGSASVYQGADGRLIVGIEELDLDPGPDLQVWLVPRADARTRSDGIHLGHLRANRGTQYYDVPFDTEIDVATGVTVVLWSRIFGFAIAHAPQTPL